MVQDKDIQNASATTTVLMENFETVEDLANADLDQLTAFITETGRGRFLTWMRPQKQYKLPPEDLTVYPRL